MPTGQLTKRFYPTLASVVNEDEIPDILGFIKEGIVFLYKRMDIIFRNKSNKSTPPYVILNLLI